MAHIWGKPYLHAIYFRALDSIALATRDFEKQMGPLVL